MWNFTGYHWNSTQNIWPIDWITWFSYHVEKSSQIYELLCISETAHKFSYTALSWNANQRHKQSILQYIFLPNSYQEWNITGYLYTAIYSENCAYCLGFGIFDLDSHLSNLPYLSGHSIGTSTIIWFPQWWWNKLNPKIYGKQDTSACKISGHSLDAFSGECPETPNLTRFTKSK